LSSIDTLLAASAVHPQWQPLLVKALKHVDTAYLDELVTDSQWLPGKANIFSAFKRDLDNCQFILFGESPYPRYLSANGIAFYDAAVTDLWSNTGLSKGVNRATSLRNIMKCALLSEGHLALDSDGKITQQAIAQLNKEGLIKDIAEFFGALQTKGFLLCNTTPVLHEKRKPAIEARFWQPFINQLLIAIKQQKSTLPTLVLWGKVALLIDDLAIANSFKKISCEHPYNLSFIQNPKMQTLFAQLQLLSR